MKICELFSDESKWAKGDGAYNADGEPIASRSPFAVKWCLMGAAYRCYPLMHEYGSVIDRIRNAVRQEPAIWNDLNTRIFTDVKELVEKLDV